MVPPVWLQPITGAFTGQFEDKRDEYGYCITCKTHWRRSDGPPPCSYAAHEDAGSLACSLIELKAYREAAATVTIDKKSPGIDRGYLRIYRMIRPETLRPFAEDWQAQPPMKSKRCWS